MINIKWSADKYAEHFFFSYQYGNSIIELIEVDKGSSILDLGCRNGALAKASQEKVYLVISLNLDIARKNYLLLNL